MDFATVSYILNGIGMGSSLICLLLFLLLASRNIKYINRITFKLQAALSLADFLFHLFVILSWGGSVVKLCSFYAFMISISKSAYYCIVFIITLNLHLNVLYAGKIRSGLVRYFWTAIIVFPILHTVPLYAFGMFGENSNKKCFITGSGLSSKIVMFTNVIIPITTVFMYCAVVALMISLKTTKSDEIVHNMVQVYHIQNDASKLLLKKILNNWILRIMLYPITFCVIHCGTLVDFFTQAVFSKNKYILYWAISCSHLSGFFNLIAFLCDPYFQSAIKLIFDRVSETSDSFSATLNFAGENHHYEMEVQSLASKDSVASSICKATIKRRRFEADNHHETEDLLRDLTKDL